MLGFQKGRVWSAGVVIHLSDLSEPGNYWISSNTRTAQSKVCVHLYAVSESLVFLIGGFLLAKLKGFVNKTRRARPPFVSSLTVGNSMNGETLVELIDMGRIRRQSYKASILFSMMGMETLSCPSWTLGIKIKIFLAIAE